jgi:hypothetical protein
MDTNALRNPPVGAAEMDKETKFIVVSPTGLY